MRPARTCSPAAAKLSRHFQGWPCTVETIHLQSHHSACHKEVPAEGSGQMVIVFISFLAFAVHPLAGHGGHLQQVFGKAMPSGSCRLSFPLPITQKVPALKSGPPETLTQHPGLHPPSHMPDKLWLIPHRSAWEAKKACIPLTPVLKLEERGILLTSSRILTLLCLEKQSS